MNLAPVKVFILAVAALTLTGSTVLQGCSSSDYRTPQPTGTPSVSAPPTEPSYPSLDGSSEVLQRAEKKRECYEHCQSEYDKAVAQCPRYGDLDIPDAACSGELLRLHVGCMGACEERYGYRDPYP